VHPSSKHGKPEAQEGEAARAPSCPVIKEARGSREGAATTVGMRMAREEEIIQSIQENFQENREFVGIVRRWWCRWCRRCRCCRGLPVKII